MVDLDTGSYGYDIDGFHLSQVDRLRESEYGSELSGMVSEGTIYNAFFYGLSDAGSPNMYRDTASPSQ